jgi:hypothetical protein
VINLTGSETFAYQLVDAIPEVLDPGVVYVSHRYATAAHLCACGCRSEVVTPLGAGGWRLKLEVRGLSLSPSIGNASFACKSHYHIVRGSIVWEGQYTDDMIQRARRRDNPRAHEEAIGLPTTPTTPTSWNRFATWVRDLLRLK